MDPTTLRSYIADAQYRRQQAEQTRTGYELDAQNYASQAADYEARAQTYRKYAEDARDQANSYVQDEENANRDIEYYSNQLMQAEQEAERERVAAQY